jgi:hypothetical protein
MKEKYGEKFPWKNGNNLHNIEIGPGIVLTT